MFFITHTKSRMRRLISVYLDGELDPKRTARLMAHLETCARCRARLAAEQEFAFTVAEALRKEETPDILVDVLSALNRRKGRESHAPGRLLGRALKPVIAYSAAALFGIAVGILVSSSLGASTTTASDPLPVQYLSEAPPNSLITLYYGDAGEVTNE
jgi:anti-sigma factor RsiW